MLRKPGPPSPASGTFSPLRKAKKLRRFFFFGGHHAERFQVEIEHRFLFLALVGVLLAERDHLAQDLGVEAVALGLGVDFLDVGGDRLLLLLKPLDALDQELLSWPWAKLVLVSRHDNPLNLNVRAICREASCSPVWCMRLPVLVVHAVDHGPGLLAGTLSPLRRGRFLEPVGKAVAAETGEIHQSMFCTSVRLRKCSRSLPKHRRFDLYLVFLSSMGLGPLHI